MKAARATKEPKEVLRAIYAHELSARCKIGQWIAENPDIGPGKGSTLEPLGIDKKKSHRWQMLAKVETSVRVALR